MKTWALVQNGVCVNPNVISDVSDPRDTVNLWIDVSTRPDKPSKGWLYDNKLDLFTDPNAQPPPVLTDLEILEAKSLEYIGFGRDLFIKISQKVWATNVLAANNGQPLSTDDLTNLLRQSDSLEKALRSGSLRTAIAVLNQLTQVLPQYTDIGQFAINEINVFMRPPG